MILAVAEVIRYTIFIVLVMGLVYVNRDVDAYGESFHCRDILFSPYNTNFTNISTIPGVWLWIDNILIESLYKEGNSYKESHLLINPPRLRQFRINGIPCYNEELLPTKIACKQQYDRWSKEVRSYNGSWEVMATSNVSTEENSPWMFVPVDDDYVAISGEACLLIYIYLFIY